MTKVECIARTLCSIEGRVPDYCPGGKEPQWRRYESQARDIVAALKKRKHQREET